MPLMAVLFCTVYRVVETLMGDRYQLVL